MGEIEINDSLVYTRDRKRESINNFFQSGPNFAYLWVAIELGLGSRDGHAGIVISQSIANSVG